MRKIYLFVFLISIGSFSQQKKNWFFGVEVGINTVTSYNLGEANKSFQGGFVAEYFFSNHWSLIGKLKHFKKLRQFWRSFFIR